VGGRRRAPGSRRDDAVDERAALVGDYRHLLPLLLRHLRRHADHASRRRRGQAAALVEAANLLRRGR
jgi:hypothetical protein